MKVLSIQVGKPREVSWRGKTIHTGIFKTTVKGPVSIGSTQMEGDGQADLTVHGGRDKAVYAYGWDTVAWWQRAMPNYPFAAGIFGENLTLDRLDESLVCAGDVFALGSARLQAAEPRFPCFKLGIRFGDPEVVRTFAESGRPGVYFRVLDEGSVREGDELILRDADVRRVSILEMAETTLGKPDRHRIERILSVASLSAAWRHKFEEKLASLGEAGFPGP